MRSLAAFAVLLALAAPSPAQTPPDGARKEVMGVPVRDINFTKIEGVKLWSLSYACHDAETGKGFRCYGISFRGSALDGKGKERRFDYPFFVVFPAKEAAEAMEAQLKAFGGATRSVQATAAVSPVLMSALTHDAWHDLTVYPLVILTAIGSDPSR